MISIGGKLYVTDAELVNVTCGTQSFVGGEEGTALGFEVVGRALGLLVGEAVGLPVGPEVGVAVGLLVGPEVGVAVGAEVGPEVGLALGEIVGDALGAPLGHVEQTAAILRLSIP
jgi:hypothetical protein